MDQPFERSSSPAAARLPVPHRRRANAARLGQLDAAWPVILAQYRRETNLRANPCRVERGKDDGNCPAGQEIEYPDYPTALRAYLAELGYIPADE